MPNVRRRYVAHERVLFCVFCCVTAVSLAPTELKCYRIAFGYNCSWNPPVDDGGEAVVEYCYGYTEGRDASCLTSSVCQLYPRRAVGNALEEGTAYVFYVYAVNSIGNGNCSTDVVTTLIGMCKVIFL